MWARNLGVPHLWPSRVKVFFLAILTTTFNFSVFRYLHDANVEYLDLENPLKQNIRCMQPIPECLHAEDPVECTVRLEDRQFWRGMNLSKPCPMPSKTLHKQTCRNPLLPLGSITGELGSLHTVNSGVNPFKVWSILFLALTTLLSVCILIHDLALLHETLRPQILSLPNMKYATPCLWDCLACTKCRRRWRRRLRVLPCHRALWTFLVPCITLFQVIAFMVFMYPFSLLVCFVAPVKMSRIMVFLSSILCILWSIVFVVVTALLDNHPYAVLWGISDPRTMAHSCLCLCEFPLSRQVLGRVVLLGVGVCWHSLNLTLRALRGLRRAQWANMFSVLYAVPIEAFPVVWDRPPEAGGGSIRWRTEGQAVQSEPAFDPFCLMDEQPESGWTRVQIAPVVKMEQQQFEWDPYTGALDTEIGCCGFPRPVQIPEEDTDGDDFGKSPFTTEETPSHNPNHAEEDLAPATTEGPSAAALEAAQHAALGGTILGRPCLPEPAIAGQAGPEQTSPSLPLPHRGDGDAMLQRLD